MKVRKQLLICLAVVGGFIAGGISGFSIKKEIKSNVEENVPLQSISGHDISKDSIIPPGIYVHGKQLLIITIKNESQ